MQSYNVHECTHDSLALINTSVPALLYLTTLAIDEQIQIATEWVVAEFGLDHYRLAHGSSCGSLQASD